MEKLIPVKDLGVTLGYGLFETLKVYKGAALFVEEHLNRLMKSGRELFLVNVPGSAPLAKLIHDYIKKSNLNSRAVRLSITYGNETEGVAPHVFISDRAISYEPLDYERGIAVALSSYRKNEYSPIVQHKTFNQLENVLSLKLCKQKNVTECIFLNTTGYLAEGSKSNIFFVREGKIFTPSEDCGLLPGITRRKIIDLLKQQGIETIEGKYAIEELYACDECLCTNSLMGVMPIVKINERHIGSGRPGQLTGLALSLYEECIEKYLTGQ